MRLAWISQQLLFAIVVIGLASCSDAVGGDTNSTHSIRFSSSGPLKKDSGSGVIGPSQSSESKRVARDFLKLFNITADSSNSTELSELDGNQQQKRSSPDSPGVQIIESGSRRRGEARILKRGSPFSTTRGGSSDSRFTLRGPLHKQRNSGYHSPSTSSLASSSVVDSLGSFQVVSIPGSDIPPPIYTYGKPGSPSIITAGVPAGSGGSYGGSGGSGGSGGGFVASTSRPDVVVVTPPGPGPTPIGPPVPGTSVPIIGGGRPILPPSPPPDEIFPPAPPPDEDEFLDDIGRRLKVESGREAGKVGIRARTRVTPRARVAATASRFSTGDTLPLTSRERLSGAAGGSGGTLRREKLRDKVTFVEEVEDPISAEIAGDDPNIITDFVFSDIKCFKTRQKEYFGATIHMKSGFHLPYIRDRPQDPLSSEECRLDSVETSRSSYHMSVTDLRGCGVEQCGDAMCLTMVFPRVPILALADDEVTTIKCIPQKSTISDTKSISFAGDSTENRRSSSTVEGGIQEFVAEVGVFRQNPGATNGLFVKRVNSGGVVQLGEPLQLRSVVRGTDGWKHSRLTDVKVWRMRDNMKQNLENLDPNQASEVITLVDAQGCRNDEYIVIANEHPIRDPRNDMVHHFTFKAFLFRGQRVNEPLIVTARVHACQELQDCLMECEGTRKRFRRSPVELHNASAIVHDFDSQLALRVVGLKDHPSSILDDGQFPFDYSSSPKNPNKTVQDLGSMTCNEKMFATGLGGGCIMLLICGLALALYTYVKQGRLHYSRNKTSPRSNRGGAAAYRYPPPPGRLMPSSTPGIAPYQKPLPPTPTSSSQQNQPSLQQQLPATTSQTASSNSDSKTMSEMSQVAKLLQELAKNNNNSEASSKQTNASGKSSSKKPEPKKKIEQSSEYACIDETSPPASSSSSSEIDLTKLNKKNKDGVYILYCYNKDKKNKLMMPLSAPSSTRMRRKHLKNMEEEEDDDDGDFICQDDDSEALASQTEEATESDDSYEEMKSSGKPSANNNNSNNGNNANNISKNQVTRRTVREVKKKSKQNNSIAYSGGGIIRRRVSSIYREGYLSGIRGAVAAAVGGSKREGGSFPLRYRKSPSTGNIPAAIANGGNGSPTDYNHSSSSGKRIHFSVRERRSARKRRQFHQNNQQRHYNDQYSTSEGILSEATTVGSDLDSAYSGSNCSKLTEDQLYELKHGGGGGGRASGRYPDFHNFHQQQNLVDVQRQLRRSGAQGHHHNQNQKQEVRRTSSSPNNNTTNVEIGLGSPPLSLGETKATHFVTRDDSTTKILIVPETHV